MVKIVKKLSDKGFPVHVHSYHCAHSIANRAEKKADPKAYAAINKMDRKLGKHELAGKHTRKGKIEIEKKFTKAHDGVSGARIKKNLITHERVETQHQKTSKRK